MDIVKILKDKKPNLSDSSIKTYANCIKKIYQAYSKTSKLFKDTDKIDLKFLQNFTRVIKIIKEEPITTQKSRLTCIVTILKAINAKEDLIKKYYDEMMKIANQYQDWLKKQEKSDKQKTNWLEQSEIDKITNDLFQKVKEFKTYDILTNSQYNELQVYTLLRLLDLYSIRNQFGDMIKISKTDYDKLTDKTKSNYMIQSGNTFKIILNKYKTAKFLGAKEYNIEKPLITILKILFKFNRSGFVVTKNDRKTELGTNGLTKLLSAWFFKQTGKRIGTSMLRHIQATQDEEGKPSILEQEKKDEEIKQKYLHNEAQHKLYAKKS